MDYTEFIKNTVLKIEQKEFEALKKMLVGEYISFNIISEDDITLSILSEKLCDYFDKLEIKQEKKFDKQIDTYINDIDSIVKKRIAKIPQAKKNDSTPIVIPRARKYYEKALDIKKSRNMSVRNLIDYSRIMFCLYTAILKNDGKEIDDFDYSAAVLIPEFIIDSMKNEKVSKLKIPKFYIEDLYCSDRSAFIMAIIMLHTILNDRVEGEYYHE